MHTIQVYIDETLDEQEQNALREELMAISHVQDVQMRGDTPHDLLVEFDEHHVHAMDIVDNLHRRGLHPDVISA